MSQIKIEVPNDDSDALHYFGEAMIKLSACIRGESPVDVRVEPITYKIDTCDEEAMERLKQATEDLMRAGPAMLRENNVDGSIELHGKRKEPDVNTTSQQVESLAIPVEANGATYETDLGSDNPEAVCVADSNGTPWDQRIHSAGKALNSDGTWRLRRKPKDMDETEWSQFVDATLIEIMPDNNTDDMGQVVDKHINAAHQGVAEQYGQGLANAAFTGDRTKSPEPPVTPPGDDFHVDAGEVTEQQIAAIAVPPLPVPTPPGDGVPPDFDDCIPYTTSNTVNPALARLAGQQSTMTFPQVMQFLTERHGRITSAQVDDIIADMGLNSIMDLNTQPEYTGPFIARVKALLGE